MLTVGSLFSGIGGIDLGLERAGFDVRWQVEIDEYAARVLSKHWPETRRYGNVQHLSARTLEAVDVLAGGFPCQPVSVAGRREAQADPRWLWPQFARLVDELRPQYVIVENVPGIFTAGLTDIIVDLATLGFDAEWHTIPAAAIGAHHLRSRLILVAYSRGARGGGKRPVARDSGIEAWRPSETRGALVRPGDGEAFSDRPWEGGEAVAHSEIFTERPRLRPYQSPAERRRRLSHGGSPGDPWDVEPNVGRVAHGVPARVDRLRGLGNSVVPQLFEWIGDLIRDHADLPN